MSAARAFTLRRIVVFAMLVAAVGAALNMLRERQSTSTAAPPEWPPFEPRIVASDPALAPDHQPVSWVGPRADGTVPDDFPVKVKVSSGIFHVRGGRFYDRTVADRHYASAEAAETDGYRRSKS